MSTYDKVYDIFLDVRNATHFTLDPRVSIDEIMDNIHLFPWDISCIHDRPDFKLEYALSGIRRYPKADWNWKELVRLYGLPILELVQEDPNACWNWHSIIEAAAQNQFVKDDETDEFWKSISRHLSDEHRVTFTGYAPIVFLKRHAIEDKTLKLRISFHVLTFRLSSDKMDLLKLIATYPEHDWNFGLVSGFDTIQIIQLVLLLVTAYPDKPWDWRKLTENAMVSNRLDVINRLKMCPWNWKTLKCSRRQKRVYPLLRWCNNLEELQKRAAIIIQRRWLQLYYDPCSSFCKKRLTRQFAEDTWQLNNVPRL